MSEKIVLMYDTDLRRPGCVLLQAAHGCDTGAFRRFFMDSEHWLVNHTPGLKRIAGTEAEWTMASKMTPKGPK